MHVFAGKLSRITGLSAAWCQVLFETCADPLQVTGQALIVKGIALTWLLANLGAAPGGIFQSVELTDHDLDVGLFGCAGGDGSRLH